MNISGPHNTAWKNIRQTREKLEEAGKVAATAGDTVRPQEGGQQAWLPRIQNNSHVSANGSTELSG